MMRIPFTWFLLAWLGLSLGCLPLRFDPRTPAAVEPVAVVTTSPVAGVPEPARRRPESATEGATVEPAPSLPLTATLTPEMQQQRAEKIAREYLRHAFGVAVVTRSRVESRFARGDWTIVFHDANVTCQAEAFWPPLCDLSRRPPVFRDAWLWVPSTTWRVEKVGGCEYPAVYGPEWRCQFEGARGVEPDVSSGESN